MGKQEWANNETILGQACIDMRFCRIYNDIIGFLCTGKLVGSHENLKQNNAQKSNHIHGGCFFCALKEGEGCILEKQMNLQKAGNRNRMDKAAVMSGCTGIPALGYKHFNVPNHLCGRYFLILLRAPCRKSIPMWQGLQQWAQSYARPSVFS